MHTPIIQGMMLRSLALTLLLCMLWACDSNEARLGSTYELVSVNDARLPARIDTLGRCDEVQPVDVLVREVRQGTAEIDSDGDVEATFEIGQHCSREEPIVAIGYKPRGTYSDRGGSREVRFGAGEYAGTSAEAEFDESGAMNIVLRDVPGFYVPELDSLYVDPISGPLEMRFESQ